MDGAQEPRFPQTPEQLTADWLGSVLSVRWRGVSVLSLQVLQLIPGTSLKIRVALNYNDVGKARGLPETMILKGPFGRHAADVDFIFEDEMRAYRDIISQVGLNTPE